MTTSDTSREPAKDQALDRPPLTESIVTQADLANLLRANLKNGEETLKILAELKKYIRWQQIWSAIRLLLIVVPLVLGVIYLPPIIKDVFSVYQSFLK
jgi:hypothetical protein